jgi:hypothetical protein
MKGQIGIQILAVLWLGLCPFVDPKIFSMSAIACARLAYTVTGSAGILANRGRRSWFAHPCVSFLSCVLDGFAVPDLLQPPFSFTYLHSWASVAAPAFPHPVRHFASLPFPFYHHACMNSCTTTSFPPHPLYRPVNSIVRGPLDVLYGFRGDLCVWSGCQCAQAQRKRAPRCRACQRGQVTEAGFAWHCAALVGLHLPAAWEGRGVALAQGRGGMLEAV